MDAKSIGSAIIAAAKEHLDSQGMKEIVIPEWRDENDQPFVIYHTPCTLAEKNRIFRKGGGANADNLECLVFAVILKATDADGNRLFSLKDKSTLLNEVDSDVLSRIAAEILDAEDAGEIKKK